VLCHGGENVDVNVRIVDRMFGRPSRRIIRETVRVEGLDERSAMSGRGEWSCLGLNRHLYGVAKEL